MRIFRAVAAALLAGAAALPAVAVEVHRDRDVYWVSGGVGADERDEMVMALPDHNLKVLTAAEKSGAFLSAVEVVVRDAGGRPVFETSLDGPVAARPAPAGRLCARRDLRRQTGDPHLHRSCDRPPRDLPLLVRSRDRDAAEWRRAMIAATRARI